MLSILKGGLISVTGGKWITDLPEGFHLADIELFGILPMPVLIMVIATILAALWMRYSASGRAIYATGGNAEAARLCGVSPQRTVVMVFALHGFFAAIAALLFATQLKVIQSTTPTGLELTIITASVVGGVSILGGVGTVIGATLAAILIAEIASALVFINVSPYWIHALAGRFDPRHRHRRHPAAPTPHGGRLGAMAVLAQNLSRGAPRWLARHETLLAAILVVALVDIGFVQRALSDDRQPAQPGAADDRGRAHRACR